jgi:hypothetical protein
MVRHFYTQLYTDPCGDPGVRQVKPDFYHRSRHLPVSVFFFQATPYLALGAPLITERRSALAHDGIPLLECGHCEPKSVQFLGRCSKWIIHL